MGTYEYVVQHNNKHSHARSYESVCEELRSHLWQIEEVDPSLYEIRSGKEGYYIRPRGEKLEPSRVKRFATAGFGMYGPIYIVLHSREGNEVVTILGNKNDVLQAAFVVSKKP